MEVSVAGVQGMSPPTETQIFPGAGLSPAQQAQLRQNLENNRRKIEVQEIKQVPEFYNYIFTRNYVIFSTFLIVLAFAVFGVIIYIQLTRFVAV